MQCPVDQTVLQMTDRQGVEIDYCPTCRGVWLDRGELDKIIETLRGAGRTRRPAGTGPLPRPGPADRGVGYPQRHRRATAYAQQRRLPAVPAVPEARRTPRDYRGGYGQGYDPRLRPRSAARSPSSATSFDF